jgi:hypothetical protein
LIGEVFGAHERPSTGGRPSGARGRAFESRRAHSIEVPRHRFRCARPFFFVSDAPEPRLRSIGGGGILNSRMSSPVRWQRGVRRFIAFSWIVALATVRAPELAARGSHTPSVDPPDSAAVHSHHDHTPAQSDRPAWIASPDPCEHCARGNGCHESPGCTSGCSALRSQAPAIAFEAVERLRDGWHPDRPLAENPTPPTPPPPTIL